jgi:hypothetical protein
MKIDKGKPLPKRKNKWNFNEMKPGDSFYFEAASHSTAIIAFGYYLAKGKYSLKKEGNGYRFYLLKKQQEK